MAGTSTSYAPDDPQYRIKPTQQMASSCVGALITSFIVTPFDVVKIRLQSQQKNLLSNRCFLYCNGLMDHLCPCLTSNNMNGEPKSNPTNWYTKQTHFTGTVDAIMKISRSEGIGSLWSGLGPTLVLAVPATVVYFVTYEQLRLKIKDRHQGVQPVWGPLVSGATARLLSVSLVSPLELVRTKMQSQRVSYLEIGQAIKSLLHYHGPRGLFKGLGSTLLRDVPFSAIYWMHYEFFKSQLVATTTHVPSFWISFMSGAAAGSIAAVATNPFDVVKTHQQIELGEKEIYSGKQREPTPRYRNWLIRKLTEPPKRGSSMATIIKRIYASHGVSGLFAGLTPRLVKVAPACAIMISSFEYGKLFFHRCAILGEDATFQNFVCGNWRYQEEPETPHPRHPSTSTNLQ